ncbi:hypothetical protein ACMFMF_001812 [Clarireedia jacksonii]
MSNTPPTMNNLRLKIKQPAVMYADGHHDIQKNLALSGEPILDALKEAYKLKEPISVLEYQDLALQIRNFREAYADYWDSTAGTDGKTVDAILMPTAPHAGIIPGKWIHLGTESSSYNRKDLKLIS